MKMRLFMEIHSFLSLQLLLVSFRQNILTSKAQEPYTSIYSLFYFWSLPGTRSGPALHWVDVLVFVEQLIFIFLLWDGQRILAIHGKCSRLVRYRCMGCTFIF